MQRRVIGIDEGRSIPFPNINLIGPTAPMIYKRSVWITLLWLSVAVYVAAFFRQLLSPPASFHDFPAYYLPASQMLHGANPYSTHLPEGLVPADTPAWLLCFEPLTALSPYAASWTWFWTNVAALILSLYLLIREAGCRGGDALVVAAVCLMYPPIASNLSFGQSEIFLCLLLTLMLVALRHKSDRLAGLALAAAVLLRAYPIGLVAYLFVLHRWKAIGWAFLGLMVGGIITILFVGWPILKTYIDLIGISAGFGLYGLTSTLRVPQGLMKHPANLNLGSFIKWLYDRTASRPVPIVVSAFGALSEMAAVAVCFHATLRVDPQDPDWRGFGLWIVTLSLISPLSWYFYFCCFLPFVVGMVAAWLRKSLSSPALYAITASYLISTLIPTYGHPFFSIINAATMKLNNAHLNHILSEKEFASLIFTWLAAYLFAAHADDKLSEAGAHESLPIAPDAARAGR